MGVTMTIILACVAAGSFLACVAAVSRSVFRFRGAYAPAFDTSARRLH